MFCVIHIALCSFGIKITTRICCFSNSSEIDAYMEELIPINFIDLKNSVIIPDPTEEPDITDPIIVEQVVNAIGKGVYWSVKKILEYIVPAYIQNGKLDPIVPTIHLRVP